MSVKRQQNFVNSSKMSDIPNLLVKNEARRQYDVVIKFLLKEIAQKLPGRSLVKVSYSAYEPVEI